MATGAIINAPKLKATVQQRQKLSVIKPTATAIEMNYTHALFGKRCCLLDTALTTVHLLLLGREQGKLE